MQLTPRVLFWVGESASPTLVLRHQEVEDVDAKGGALYATLKRRKMAITAAALNAIAFGGIMFIMVGIERERVLRPTRGREWESREK